MKIINFKILRQLLSILVRPSITILEVIDDDKKYFLFLLAILSGLSVTLNPDDISSYGSTQQLTQEEFSFIIGYSLVLGCILGIIMLYFKSLIFYWIGQWLDGKSTLENIRYALIWSNAPDILLFVLWFPIMGFYGLEIFGDKFYILDSFDNLQVITRMWSVIIFLLCLAKIQDFTIIKTIIYTFISDMMFAFVGIILEPITPIVLRALMNIFFK